MAAVSPCGLLYDIYRRFTMDSESKGLLEYAISEVGKYTGARSVFVKHGDTIVSWGEPYADNLKLRAGEKKSLENDEVVTHSAAGVIRTIILPVHVRRRYSGYLCINAPTVQNDDFICFMRVVAHAIGNVISRDALHEEKKIVQADMLETKSILEKIIDSTVDGVCYLDTGLRIRLWNAAAARLTGIKTEAAVGKNITELNLAYEPVKMHDFFMDIIDQDKSINNLEITFITSDKVRCDISLSFSVVRDDGRVCGIVAIMRNRSAGAAPKIVADGRGYFILSHFYNSAERLFIDLCSKKSGLFITRNRKGPSDISHHDMKLADKEAFFQGIMESIDMALAKGGSIIFLARPDYILGMYGFDDFLKLLYSITNRIQGTDSVFLVYLSPHSLDKKQLYYIEQELMEIKLDEFTSLPDNLVRILEHVKEMNDKGTLVSLNDISKRFSITRPTTGERVKKLLELGLINVRKYGRVKSLQATMEGASFLERKR